MFRGKTFSGHDEISYSLPRPEYLISFSIEIGDSSDMKVKLVTEKKHRRADKRHRGL